MQRKQDSACCAQHVFCHHKNEHSNFCPFFMRISTRTSTKLSCELGFSKRFCPLVFLFAGFALFLRPYLSRAGAEEKATTLGHIRTATAGSASSLR